MAENVAALRQSLKRKQHLRQYRSPSASGVRRKREAASGDGGTSRRVLMLEKELQREKAHCRQLRDSYLALREDRNVLQDVLRQCIDDVRLELHRRKYGAAAEQVLGRVEEVSPVQDFTAMDRQRVVERLLERHEVLTALDKGMFGAVAETGSEVASAPTGSEGSGELYLYADDDT